MWGKQPSFENLHLRLIKPDPEDGSLPHAHPLDKNAKTAFIISGLKDYPLSSLIHNAQAGHAHALFIVNHGDTDVNAAELPDHLSGVQIHVFLVNKTTGDTLRLMLSQVSVEDAHPEIEVEFTQMATHQKQVNLQIIGGPDDEKLMDLLARLYNSSFTSDVEAGSLSVTLNYQVLHCAACEQNHFKTHKEDCLSGGRYCMRPAEDRQTGGETLLVQGLKNVCAEEVLRREGRIKALMEYYWVFNQSCIELLLPRCTNAILKKLAIKDEVMRCVNDSFLSMTDDETKKVNEKKGGPNILLQDNAILKKQKKAFSKVQYFNRFPMAKVNGWIYNGDLEFGQLLGFVCLHIKPDLNGCQAVVQFEGEDGAFFKWMVFLVLSVVFAAVIYICKTRLKHKFKSELAYQIDQSVNSYLQRTGVDL